MLPIMNSSAALACCHQGTVTVPPRQAKVLVGGAPALCAGDIGGNPVGCPVPPSPSSKPCTTATAPPVPGVSVSTKVFVGGKPVMLGSPSIPGVTDSLPAPCPVLTVRSAGQTTVLVTG
jgi:hypothetical protein